MTNITGILVNWNAAPAHERDSVYALLHGELSNVAARQLGDERQGDILLEPGMLVNEAFLRLADLDAMTWQGRAHFLATAARVMRQVLLDHARRRQSQKRDAGVRVQLTLAAAEGRAETTDAFLLDAALRQLASIDPLYAQVVEARFFGGLTVEETAEALSTNPAAVKRAWTAARAWLSWYGVQQK